MLKCGHEMKYGMLLARNDCIVCEAEHQSNGRQRLRNEMAKTADRLAGSDSCIQVRQDIITALEHDRKCDTTPES